MEKPTSIEQLMQQLPERFQPDKAANVNAVIQFNLTGEGGGAYTVSIADGKCAVSSGTAPAPNATVSAAAADYLAIARGEMNPMTAFMTGKIRVTGDMGLMMKVLGWFGSFGSSAPAGR